MLKEQENEQILNVVDHYDCQIQRENLVSNTTQIKHWGTDERQTVASLHLVTGTKWDCPLFPFPFVPIFPWFILLPSWTSFGINSLHERKTTTQVCFMAEGNPKQYLL